METTKERLPNKQAKIVALIVIIIVIGVFITGGILIVQTLLNSGNVADRIDISVETAYNMINDTGTYPDLIILDVRTQSEYDAGHINNPIWIPDTELEARIDELSGYEDTIIIVYCKTGGRSASASDILVNNDFTKVYNMLGGFDGWVAADYFVPD